MEQITIKAFAQRMAIGITTARSWIRDGILQEGETVLRHKRIIRVLWDDDLPRRVAEAAGKQKNEPRPKIEDKTYLPKINWGILEPTGGRR